MWKPLYDLTTERSRSTLRRHYWTPQRSMGGPMRRLPSRTNAICVVLQTILGEECKSLRESVTAGTGVGEEEFRYSFLASRLASVAAGVVKVKRPCSQKSLFYCLVHCGNTPLADCFNLCCYRQGPFLAITSSRSFLWRHSHRLLYSGPDFMPSGLPSQLQPRALVP